MSILYTGIYGLLLEEHLAQEKSGVSLTVR